MHCVSAPNPPSSEESLQIYFPSADLEKPYETISFSLDWEKAKKVEVIALALSHEMLETKERRFNCLCSKEMFEVAYRAINEYKSLAEALNAEQKTDPAAYEDLRAAVEYLYPSQREAFERNLIFELKHMSLAEAEALIKKQKTTPFSSVALSFAQKKIAQSIYFDDKDKAETFLKEMKELALTVLAAKVCVAMKEKESKERKASAPMDIDTDNKKETLSPEEKERQARKSLNKCHALFKKRKNSPQGKANAARFAQDKNVLLRAKALKESAQLEKYKKNILFYLAQGEANMRREDLLAYIVGPKQYLFSYYGLVPLKGASDPQHPFRCVPALRGTCEYKKRPHIAVPKGLNYVLESLGPKALEEEARRDIQELMKSNRHFPLKRLPSPLFSTFEITLPLTEELSSLQIYATPRLANWQNLSEEERRETMERLLKRNGWDAYGISPDSVKLNVLEKEEKVEEIKQGKTVQGSLAIIEGETGGRKFTFNLYDFLFLFKPQAYSEPSLKETRLILEKIARKK